MNLLDIFKNSAENVVEVAVDHAPQILVGVGIVTGVGAIAASIAATLKVPAKVEKFKKDINDIHEEEEMLKNSEEDLSESDIELLEKDFTKQKVKTYAKFAGEMCMLYAPTVALEAVSITCNIKSDHIWAARNGKIEAAALALSTSFANYRKNVRKEFGDEVDNAMRMGLHREIVAVEEEDESGKKHKVKKEIWTGDCEDIAKNIKPGDLIYNFNKDTAPFVFTDNDNGDSNYNRLLGVENYWTDVLKTRGHVFWGEISEHSGIEEFHSEGQVVGWVYDPFDELGCGVCDHIDLGLHSHVNDRALDRKDPYCDFILAPNFTGYIIPLLEKKKTLSCDGTTYR